MCAQHCSACAAAHRAPAHAPQQAQQGCMGERERVPPESGHAAARAAGQARRTQPRLGRPPGVALPASHACLNQVLVSRPSALTLVYRGPRLRAPRLWQAARDPGGALAAQHQAPGLERVPAHALRDIVPVEAQRRQQRRVEVRAAVAGRQHERARRHARRVAHLRAVRGQAPDKAPYSARLTPATCKQDCQACGEPGRAALAHRSAACRVTCKRRWAQ